MSESTELAENRMSDAPILDPPASPPSGRAVVDDPPPDEWMSDRWRSWMEHLREECSEIMPSIIELRRQLHHDPELSDHEQATTQRLKRFLAGGQLTPQVADELRGLWCDVDHEGHPAGLSGPADARPEKPSGGESSRAKSLAGEPRVAGQPHSDGESPLRIGVRGDIDALPIQTKLKTPYASRVCGVMHACGHDVHASIAAGTAMLLDRTLGAATIEQPVRMRAILQPAEENSRGATHMINAGAIQGLDAAIALHVDPTLPVGSIGIRHGVFTAACDAFELTISGTGGHGARPHLATDPLHAGADWITQVYQHVPRCHDSRHATAISVGMFESGIAPNVIPSTATLSGTLRTTDADSRHAAIEQLQRITRSIEQTHQVKIDLDLHGYTPAVVNDERLSESLERAARSTGAVQEVVRIEQPSMGAEDFAFYGERIPISMFRLGTASSDATSHPLHTPEFDVDEAAIGIGVTVLSAAVLDLATRYDRRTFQVST